MKEKKNRNGKQEQLATVTRVLTENGMDLKDVGAALTLYASLNRAKQRTGERKGYENIEFLLEKKQSKALIQLINEEPSFWNEWKAQQKIYEESGFEEDQRPSLHRRDPKGHYSLGNLAVIPYGKHLQENAVSTALVTFENGNLGIQMSDTIKTFSDALGASYKQLKDIEGQGIELSNGLPAIYFRVQQIAYDSEQAKQFRANAEAGRKIREDWERRFGKKDDDELQSV